MLKDRNGYDVKVGDRVLIPCVVTGTNESGKNNLLLQTEGEPKSGIAVNSKQVVLAASYEGTPVNRQSDEVTPQSEQQAAEGDSWS